MVSSAWVANQTNARAQNTRNPLGSYSLQAMVRLGDYELTILAESSATDCPRENRDGTVELPDSTYYALRLRNDGPLRAAATLHIDGVRMGAVLVEENGGEVVVERPVRGEARKFRFDAVGGSNATRAGAAAGAPTNGLVTAKFVPERAKSVPVKTKTGFASEKAKPFAFKSLGRGNAADLDVERACEILHQARSLCPAGASPRAGESRRA